MLNRMHNKTSNAYFSIVKPQISFFLTFFIGDGGVPPSCGVVAVSRLRPRKCRLRPACGQEGAACVPPAAMVVPSLYHVHNGTYADASANAVLPCILQDAGNNGHGKNDLYDFL